MPDPQKTKIDIKGKKIVNGEKILTISGESLVLIGEIISNDEKKIVLNGTILEIDGQKTPCWIYKNCPDERRSDCPAYPHHGYNCMSIMKTLCKGVMQDKMLAKLSNCNRCNFVFDGNHSVLAKHQMKFDQDGNPIKK